MSHPILSHPVPRLKTTRLRRRPPAASICILFLTESPASFHRNPTLTESDSCHQTGRKNLAFAPRTALRPERHKPPPALAGLTDGGAEFLCPWALFLFFCFFFTNILSLPLSCFRLALPEKASPCSPFEPRQSFRRSEVGGRGGHVCESPSPRLFPTLSFSSDTGEDSLLMY